VHALLSINRQVAIILIFFATLVTAAFAEDIVLIDVPKHDTVVLKFIAFDPARVLIDESQLLRMLTSNLQGKSKFPLRSDNHPVIQEQLGLRAALDQRNSKIIFQYVHVNHHRDGSEYGQWLSFPVSYVIERNNDDVTIQLIPPEKSEMTTRRLLFMPPPKLGPANELLDDFSNVLNAAPTVKIKMLALVKGEVTSNFKPESILGNFERLLGRHKYGYSEERKYDLKRDNVFSYQLGQERFPLKVAVFPYRDGTKIVFEAFLPYQISADGYTEGFDVSETLKNDVQKIVND